MREFEYKFGDRPLEGYTIQRAVGRGGFGEVYYAVSDSGRQVALKAIQGYEQIELRGVTQCMNLKNPHLVSIFDIRYGEGGRPFVIMEYVWGPSLRDILDRSPGGLGAAKSAFFLREIATGLTYLHNCGIVHRDLKPGNIFCEDGTVKIGDYGLSKAMSASRASGQTITVGTVHYMAPEIGAGRYDRSVDIYALGIVLYEMLTGQVPFEGASPGEILMKHLSAAPKLEGIEEPFADVLRRALDKDPDKRYSTAQEMADDLFRSEALRASVAALPPESLSMAGVRPATAPSKGPPRPPPLPQPPRVPPRPVPPPPPPGAGAKGTNVAEDIRRQIQGDARKLQDRLRAEAEQIRSRGGPGRPPSPGMTIAQAAALDPVKAGVRRLLFVAAAFAMALGTALVDGGPRGAQNEMLWAFLAILGAGVGIVMARARWPLPGSFLMHRVVYGLAGCLPAWVGMVVAWSSAMDVRGGGWLEHSATMLPAGLCILDWHRRTSPERPARVQLKQAFMAGLVGLVLAACFHGNGVLVAGILAGISLAVQALMPLAPKQATLGDGEAPPPPGQEHASPHNGEAWHQEQAWHQDEAWQQVPAPAATYPPAAASSLRYQPVPPLLRGLSLAAFVILLAMGPLLLIFAGKELRGGEFLLGLCAGLVAIEFGIFFLVKGCQRGFRSWRGSVIKPLLLVSCAAVATCAFVNLVGNRHSAREAVYLALFFLFTSTIVFVVIAAVFSRLDAPRPLPAPVGPVGPPGTVSPKRRLTAMLLTFPFFFGIAGLHRLYVGKIGTGLLWLFTHGLFGIGQIYDFVMIVTGQFKDAAGLPVVNWDQPSPLAAGWQASAVVTEASPPPTPMQPSPQSGEARRQTSEHASPQGGEAWHQQRQLGAGGALLLAAGGVLMVAAMLVGVAAAIDLPSIVGAGSNVPRFAGEYEFGYPGWPGTLEHVGMKASAVLMLLAATLLIVARRRAGLAHMVRAVAGAGGLLGSLWCLRAAVWGVGWADIVAMVHANRVGLAVETFFQREQEGPAIMAAALFLVSIMILVWPSRPRLQTSVPGGGE
jgi:TM2 domain-containing membrane protein YozV